MKKIGIIGAGSWGTALAMLLCRNKHKVTVWSWDAAQIQMIKNTHHNEAFIHDARLDDKIIFTDSLDFLPQCEIVVLSVPSHAIGEVCARIKPYINSAAIIVNTAKGFENESLCRLSQVIKKYFPDNSLVVLSGPSHAEEVAKNLPTFIVAAGENDEANKIIQKTFGNKYFRVYCNNDVCGVEVGGAVKNVIALASGISEGLGFGDNAKAALLARGLAEITRLGIALGGKRETFFGLSGIGDLQVTCSSMHSRNRRAGIAIGKGKSPQSVQRDMGMVVEGINAVKNTYLLAEKYKIYMPVTTQLYNILFNNVSPKNAFHVLMSSKPGNENDGFEC